MPYPRKDGGLTIKEQRFCLHYFKGRNPTLAAIEAGYPEGKGEGGGNASNILRRQGVKAYLRKLWEKAESPIVMSVRERKEVLSQIGRGMIGNCIDENGNIDLKAIREMPAVSNVVIEEETVGKRWPKMIRTIRIKLHNPIDSIHELNLMEKLYRTNEGPATIGARIVNIYVTGEEVKGKLARIGDRTQKAIDVVSHVVEEATENEE